MINMKYFFNEMNCNDLIEYGNEIKATKKALDEMEKELIKYMMESRKFKEQYATLSEYAKEEFGWTRQTLYNKIK